MKLGGLEIRESTVYVGYEQELAALQTPFYDKLAEQTAKLVSKPQYADEDRKGFTALIPLTYFSIQATLHVLKDNKVAENLPKEIYKRANVASACARAMITFGITKGGFERYYMTSPHLGRLQRDPVLGIGNALRGKDDELTESLSTLGDAALYDASLVMGGALRFLKHDRSAPADELPADIVGRSTGLQDITGVRERNLPRMRKFLGWPYVSPRHIERSGDELIFKEKARTAIRSLYAESRGCPARQIPRQEGQAMNIFGQSWVGMANLYLQPDAIATGNLQSKVKMRV